MDKEQLGILVQNLQFWQDWREYDIETSVRAYAM